MGVISLSIHQSKHNLLEQLANICKAEQYRTKEFETRERKTVAGGVRWSWGVCHKLLYAKPSGAPIPPSLPAVSAKRDALFFM